MASSGISGSGVRDIAAFIVRRWLVGIEDVYKRQVVESPRKLIAARDPFGFKPLCIGKRDNAYIVTSETVSYTHLTAEDIRDSVDEFVKAIDKSQIIMFPGGFAAGDEPEGSAKFFATAFRNAKMTEAVEKLINERDGLALGICNGFQALIKLGLCLLYTSRCV